MPDLRVMLEWRAWPLWTRDGTGGEDTPDPRTIAGDPLGAELIAWAEDYDSYWDADDPRGPDFPDRDTELAFFARGRALAERLAAQVGDQWAVRFMDADGQWVQLS
jgi:hypothetical protein